MLADIATVFGGGIVALKSLGVVELLHYHTLALARDPSRRAASA